MALLTGTRHMMGCTPFFYTHIDDDMSFHAITLVEDPTMFDFDSALLVHLEAAQERATVTPEARYELYRVRLVQRLNRTNKAEQRALRLLARHQVQLNTVRARISGKQIDQAKFRTLPTRKAIISSQQMMKGLDEIEFLPQILSDLIRQPLYTENDNLAKFKRKLRTIVENHASGYAMSDSHVYAKFLTPDGASMLKRDVTLAYMGYSPNFLPEYERAVLSAGKAVPHIRGLRDGITHLHKPIVEGMLAEPAKAHILRRQHDLICNVYQSLLENSWNQYLDVAEAVVTTLATFYTAEEPDDRAHPR